MVSSEDAHQTEPSTNGGGQNLLQNAGALVETKSSCGVCVQVSRVLMLLSA